MMSAPSCSMSRRVSLIARPEVSLPHPTPTNFSGCPLIAPPVKPARGLFGFTGLAPANCENAATAPAMSWLSNEPNAPWHSESIAILIGLLLPPVCGATAAYPAGVAVDDGVDAVDFAAELAVPLLDLSLEPQAATTRAAAASRSARTAPLKLLTADIPSPLLPAALRARRLLYEPVSVDAPRSPAGTRPAEPPSPLISSGRGVPRVREIARCQSPTRPSGDTSTMIRKIAPISVWKRSLMKPMSGA